MEGAARFPCRVMSTTIGSLCVYIPFLLWLRRGARHGHSMKAKHDRIARMEAKLLSEMATEDKER